MTGSRILVQRGVADEGPPRAWPACSKTCASAMGWTRKRIWDRSSTRPTSPASTAWSRRPWLTPSPSCRGWPPRPMPPWPAGRSTGRPCSRSRTSTTDLVQKEVFGPVATFEVFDTETDAIRARPTPTEYGLAAGIFTTNINTSRRVSREIQAGTVWTKHVGGHQRRLRRGRLQAKRHRPPARPSRHHRVPGSQDRRPRHPAAPGLTPPGARRRAGEPDLTKGNPVSASRRRMRCPPGPIEGRRPVVAETCWTPMSSTAWFAPDATYVSLNAENAELSKILPWAGTSRGPQGVPRQAREHLHSLGSPGVQRDHDVRLRRETWPCSATFATSRSRWARW